MRLVLNIQDEETFNIFLKISKSKKDNVEIINANSERKLLNNINVGDVDAFIIENSTTYYQKSIDFIRKKHPDILIIIIGEKELDKIDNADIYLPLLEDLSYFYSLIIKSIINYQRNFSTLKKLTVKCKNKVEFGDCYYEPNLRILFYNGKEISKLSEKTGGILEILAINFNKLVKKELILEKVWLKSDYFSSRSMDVYVSNLRKIFDNNNINVKIKNVSKSGLILY